jgi:protein TonB
MWLIATLLLASQPAIRVGSDFCGGMTHYVRAVYPRDARRKHIQGVVKIKARISTKGVPYQLEVIEGDPLLSRAALAAVKQWRYKPCLLNSQPVEVITQLDVNFISSQ